MRRLTALLFALLIAAVASTANAAATALRPAFPAQVVAVTTRGHVVVLDARDGHRVRTLTRRASRYGGLAVRANTVYFLSRGGASVTTCGHGAPPDQHVIAVPLSGGRPRPVLATSVRWFDVSPDGRTLAVTEGRCPPAATITTYDLATAAMVGRWAPTSLPEGTSGDVSGLAWSPDSRSLLVTRETETTGPWIVDTTSASSLDDAHRVPVGRGVRLTGFVGPSGSLVGVRSTADRRVDVSSFDAVSGARERRLFCCGTPLGVDASGTAVLASTARATLVRWATVDGAPTPIAHGVTQAVWVDRRTP